MMMHFSSALLGATLLFVGTIPSQTDAACASTDTNDIVSLACDAANEDTFGTLCDLLIETGLDSTLDPAFDFFVFAPNNDAFTRAGDRAGFTIAQKQATLKYHVSSDSSALECGDFRDSLLSINGVVKQTETRCTGGDLQGQDGIVRLPTPDYGYPRFVTPDSFITACNGVIAEIGEVMGFGTQIYSYGQYAPCSFFDNNCYGAKGAKGGAYHFHSQTVDDITFNNVFYHKHDKKYGRWSNLNQYQSFYANSVANQFDPYFNNGYRGGKAGKAHKGGYYNNYYSNYYNNYYRGGKGGKGGNYWWRRDRNLRGAEEQRQQQQERQRQPSAYEPTSAYYGSYGKAAGGEVDGLYNDMMEEQRGQRPRRYE